MKRFFALFTSILLLLNIITLTSCGKKEYSEKNLTAQSAFSQFSVDSKRITLFCRADMYLKTIDFNGTALIGLGDSILFEKGYGYSDLENKQKNDVNTVYDIASITKQFTAAAIMRLCEDGLLSVEDPLDKFFPEYERAKGLTVYDLLTMQSGLREYTDIAFGLLENPWGVGISLQNDFPDIYRVLANGIFTNSEIDQRVLLPYIFSEHSGPVKGESFYCNSNYMLLGLIIEQASGKSYEEYIQSEFFDKIGMKNSNLNGITTAKGYINDMYIGGLNPDLLWAAGGICSDVNDIFKWDRALFSGRAVSRESFEKMISPVGDMGYGFGLVIKGDTVYHEGQMLYFAGVNTVDTAHDITIILLTNIPDYNHVTMYERELMDITGEVYEIS